MGKDLVGSSQEIFPVIGEEALIREEVQGSRLGRRRKLLCQWRRKTGGESADEEALFSDVSLDPELTASQAEGPVYIWALRGGLERTGKDCHKWLSRG